MTDEAPATQRLLLVHWEGADWPLLHPLLEAGLMPTLARLLGGSTRGTFVLNASPALQQWTTLVTGADPGAAPPLWAHLAASGGRPQVVAWPYGSASEGGAFVAPAYARDPATTAEEAVQPASLAASLAPFRVTPPELSAIHLQPFLPFLGERPLADLGLEELQPVNAVARLLAETASVHAAATWLLEHGDEEDLVVHYDAFDRFGKQFRRFHHSSDAPPPLVQKLSQVMTSVARFHDMMLERLLTLAGPEYSVVLVGLPGTVADSDATGFAIFHGSPFHPGRDLPDLALPDVVPTTLAALGRPIPRACTGRVQAKALAAAPRPTYVETQASAVPPSPVASPGARDTQFYDARTALRRGRPEEARPILERLYEETVDPAHGMQLVLCYLRLKRPTDARRTLDRLLAEREHRLAREGVSSDTPLPAPLELLNAKVLRAEKSYPEALASLRRAETAAPQTALFYRRLGAVYLQLRQWPDAERVFRRALAIAPRFAAAHRWLSVALIRQGQFEEAAKAAGRAAALRSRFPAAHYHRAIALMRLGRYEEAAEAAEACVAQQPAFSRAHYLLTQLYRDHLGQPAKAMKHLMFEPDAASPPPPGRPL